MANLDIRPAALPITVYYKGDVSARFTFTLNSAVFPLTGATAAFTIYEKNGTAALTLSGGSGLTINEAGGYIDLAITHLQIVALYSQEYNYEFIIVIDGETWPILDSVFTVSEDGQSEASVSDINISIDGTNVDVSVIAPITTSGGGTPAWGDITGTLADQTDLQSALDGKSDVGHTHPLSDLTQSGATTNQVPKWTGSAWVPDDEAGGASITDITYADMEMAITNATLTPGQFYRITDASGTDLGFVCQAVRADEITVNGTGGYLNADFQAVGDYSGVEAITGVTPGTQLGIWRTGFEQIEIPIVNLTPDSVTYSTSSGVLDDAETFTTDLGTTGTVIHDDGAGTVTIEFPSQALVAGEIITGDLSGNTVTVDAYTNPVFIAGDTITGGTTGATAIVVSFDENVGSIFAYMTSPGVAFDGSETLDNGAGVTADQDGAAIPPTIAQGDMVIWNLLHYQLTDAAQMDGNNPADNTSAYTQLLKTDADQGYIETWDVSEFDFPNNQIGYRQDLLGGLVRGATAVASYQFGRDACTGNNIQSPDAFDIRNLVASFNNNTTYPGAVVSDIVTGIDTTIRNNIVENAAQMTDITAGSNCNITDNRIGKNAVFRNTIMADNCSIRDCEIFGAFESMTLDDSTISGNFIHPNASIRDSTFIRTTCSNNCLFSGTSINNIVTGIETAIEKNIIENGGQLTGITAGSNCSISRNKIGQEATLGGSTTMGDGAAFNYLDIRANKQISNKALDAGVTFSDKIVQLTTDAAETYSANVDGNRTSPGFSDIPGTLDITGLTTLDCTAEWAQYRGIFNLTSSNATEAIDTITSPPTLFPFTLRPAEGLTLTVTGTAYAGIAAGQIALKAANYVLDGDKGEYIVLEIDQIGTGCLVEKLVVNGLI